VSIVVSDTSPIRALHHLGLLGILGQLFDRVIVPPAVLHGLTQPRPRFVAVDLGQYAFVDIRTPHDPAQVQQLRSLLDAGESEALVLAIEVGAVALLIDETTGRSIAVGKGMQVIGTLGILSRAKARGYIATIGPLLDKLVVELDFYISEQLRDEFLSSCGE